MPNIAATVAVTRYQSLCSVASCAFSSRSRMSPPPIPITIPMIATPSRSSRRSPWNPEANSAPWMPPSPTATRSAHSGITKSGSVTRPLWMPTAPRAPGRAPDRDNGSVPTYRDEIVVLRTHKLGEADRIVTMLSRSHGKLRAVAKGVRRTSSRFGARLEPFMVADVQLYQGRSLDIVQQAESIGAYGAEIAVHYDRYTSASAMVEAADRLNEAEATPNQYLLLVGGLRALSLGEHASRSILDSYLLRAMALSGWAPSLSECARCGAPGPHDSFVAQLGGLVCRDCAPMGAARVDAETVSLLRALMSGTWEEVDGASEHATAAASGLVAAYTQWHLERGIRSLDHVEYLPWVAR